MFGYNNDRLFPDKYTVKDHISNTKLEKGDHYYFLFLFVDCLFVRMKNKNDMKNGLSTRNNRPSTKYPRHLYQKLDSSFPLPLTVFLFYKLSISLFVPFECS